MAEIKKKSNCALGCDEKSNQIFGEGDGRKGGEFGGELIPPKKNSSKWGGWKAEEEEEEETGGRGIRRRCKKGDFWGEGGGGGGWVLAWPKMKDAGRSSRLEANAVEKLTARRKKERCFWGRSGS